MPNFSFKLTRTYRKEVIATVSAENMNEAAAKIYRGQVPSVAKKMEKAELEFLEEKLVFYKEG